MQKSRPDEEQEKEGTGLNASDCSHPDTTRSLHAPRWIKPQRLSKGLSLKSRVGLNVTLFASSAASNSA